MKRRRRGMKRSLTASFAIFGKNGGERGIRTLGGLRLGGFQDRCLKPLDHFSAFFGKPQKRSLDPFEQKLGDRLGEFGGIRQRTPFRQQRLIVKHLHIGLERILRVARLGERRRFDRGSRTPIRLSPPCRRGMR